MKPAAGRQSEVDRINRELVQEYRRQEGCMASYFISALDGGGEVGRVTIWDSEADSDRAATNPHSLALRSELHLLVLPGHVERAFAAH